MYTLSAYDINTNKSHVIAQGDSRESVMAHVKTPLRKPLTIDAHKWEVGYRGNLIYVLQSVMQVSHNNR